MTEYALKLLALKKSMTTMLRLKGIDLKITKGDFCLTWPNGAGKSSTIGIISYDHQQNRWKYKNIWY